jgi:hypothetical protein
MTIERESSPPRHAVVDVEKKRKEILRQSEMENDIGLSIMHGSGKRFPAGPERDPLNEVGRRSFQPSA